MKDEVVWLRRTKPKKGRHGPLSIAPDTKETFDSNLQKFRPIDDTRFTHYSTRRFTHFTQTLYYSCDSRFKETLSQPLTQLGPNTILQAADDECQRLLESWKIKELSSNCGYSRNSCTNSAPLSINDLWNLYIKDLNKFAEL